MGIKREKIYSTFEEDLAFDLYDGIHHFHPSTKKDSLQILYRLRTRAYMAWKTWQYEWDWERDDDKYVVETPEQGEEKRAAEVKRCKEEFYKIDHWVERVENGPDDQCWKLDEWNMQLYPVKRAW